MATDLKSHDPEFWKEARLRSLDPGGFGQNRVETWAKLLDVDVKDDEDRTETLPEHPDERQIRLDTDRSFVMYPDGDIESHQEQLNALLVSIFRRHPSLSYFQGFHDIITVLFLTLPPPLRLPCAEKLSLHRTRDAMGVGLEPVLGLLRFLAHLISAVDEDLAKLLKHAAPLPYFALSHLLTMLAHDIPTLPLIQHVFDYLLCRPPIAIVYLVAAIIMKRRTTEIFALNEDGDGDLGMLHSLLGALPVISDDLDPLEVEDISATPSSPTPSSCTALETVTTDGEVSFTDETETLAESESCSDSDTTQTEVGTPLRDIEDTKISYLPSSPSPLLERLSTPPLQTQAEFERPFSSSDTAFELSPSSDDLNLTPNHGETSSLPPSSPSLDSLPLRETRMPSESLDPNSEFSNSPPTSKAKSSTPITLSSLLRSADKLLEAYPPYEGYPVSVDTDHPSDTPSDTSSNTPSPPPYSNLSLIPILSSIMGPSSVIYTWSEDPAGLPTTSEAEEIVKNGVNIVHPWHPSFDDSDDDNENNSFEKEEKDLKDEKRQRRVVRVNPQNLVLGLGAGAGAVLVLAVALALYGSRGTRHGIGERISLEGLLGVLGAWSAWGWATFR